MPAVPTPPTISPGVLTASHLAQYTAAINFMLNPPIADVRQAVAQSIPNATWTAATFDTEDVDTDVDGTGGHSTSSNTSRYTARYAGWYWVGGGPAFAANATGVRGTYWTNNGVALSAAQTLVSASSANETCIPARPRLVYLAAGDYLEMWVYQSSGGALNISIAGGATMNMAVAWKSR